MDEEVGRLLRFIERDPCALGADGETVDAFATDLSLTLWQARTRAEADPLVVNPEGYARVAVRNRARSLRRRRRLRARLAAQRGEASYDDETVGSGLWARQVEAAAVLGALEARLPAADWALLLRVAEAGSVRGAYAPDEGCSLRSFHTRCGRALGRARAIAEG